MNRSDWNLSHKILHAYFRSLDRLVARFFPKPGDEPQDIITALHALGVDLKFNEFAEMIAHRMVSETNTLSARTWRQAAAKSTKSRVLYEAIQRELNSSRLGATLRSLVRENSKLIKSLPYDIARETAHYINRRTLEGVRAEQTARELRVKLPELTASKARLISRTETARTHALLNQVRAEALDIRFYSWQSAEDQRVRPSHRKMDQVVVSWDDAPSPEELIGQRSTLGHYHAGMCPNCRCVALAIVDIDELKFPIKYYSKGSIARVGRAQFLKLIGGQRVAA